MNLRDIHNRAMEFADTADIYKAQKDITNALAFYYQAFEYEKQAALYSYNNGIGEPTTSVLLRSAASLAIDCNELREAEKLIALGLAGEPPAEIAEELRELLDTVNFTRHLELRGIVLQENEVQIVFAGHGIGTGMAKSDEILRRVDSFNKLAERTIERKMGKPFRKQGPVSKEIRNTYSPYISVPRDGSIAFTFRFSSVENSVISGFSQFEEVIEDITDNINLINSCEFDILHEKIKDDAYYNNFVGLTKELAPDGEDINLFGITTVKEGVQKQAYLNKHRTLLNEEFRKSVVESDISKEGVAEEIEVIIGILRFADATKNNVKVITDNKKKINLSVPDGLSDIVRNYFEESVQVTYKVEEKKNILIDVAKV